MNYIKFNNYQCEVMSFSKYTTFTAESASGNCNCQVICVNSTELQDLGMTPITSIQIIHDEEVIYNVDHISARVTTLNETLVDDHVETYITLEFNLASNNE